jgi:DNA replicative helicase MCM subunit Mcm2 (Cdc46/Mcm family)
MSNVKVIHPHDALCPSLNCIDSGCDDCCRCDLIAKVRQDEREEVREEVAERIIKMADMQAEVAAAMASDDMLAKCIAAVDARIRPTLHPLENAGIGEALSALRDLQEKP